MLLLLLLAAASAARNASAFDVAVERLRVPTRLRLNDRRPTMRARATVRIENRGATPIVVGDAATLTALVQLSATPIAGPIACAPLQIAPVVAKRFPLTVRPAHGRTLVYTVDCTCGPNPGRTADWTFRASVDPTVLAGSADDDPGDDVCPRAPGGTDPGCGVLGPNGTRVAPTLDVRDARVGVGFELPGRYGVGSTSMTLVDGSRPTMANGTFPGAPDRTLPTVVWYPTAPDAGGPDAAFASDGRPFPFVVFGHALGSYNTQSTYLATHLASHGYVVAAPAFPLMSLGAPGGSTIVDVPAQAGDVTFLIDTFLGFAADSQHRFAGGIDAARIGLSGHSGGALTALVTTYDAHLREPRIKAVVPFAPPSCFLQAGYFDTAAVPLLILQGDHDLLVDVTGDAGAAYGRAQPPKVLVVVHGGTHIGFADVGATAGDEIVCSLFPDRTDLDAEIATLLTALGGAADHASTAGCPTAYCSGDRSHVSGLRQQQIGKEVALAFFEQTLRGDATAGRYLSTLAARNPDLALSMAR